MVDIYPFQGIRYDKEKVGDIGLVATEPYDKIGTDLQSRYYERSPYNYVRIILGREELGDTKENNKYTRAAAYYQDWQRQEILTREDSPSLYLYEQLYSWEGSSTKSRKAFISMVKIEESPDVIRPHENTLSGPKADRLELLRATKSDLEQIFVLYSDSTGSIQNKLSALYNQEPLFTYTDDFQVTHKFWKITDNSVIAFLQQHMKDKDLFIADGHHRYETYINYKREQHLLHPQLGPEAACNFCMMTFVAMEDPGLTILPTHRLIKDLARFDKNGFLTSLRDNFHITAYPAGDEQVFLDSLKGRKHSFGLVMHTDDNLYLLELKSGTDVAALAGTSALSGKLDVSILHTVILDRLLGINKEKLASQTNVYYKRSAPGTIREVLTGHYQLGFILNPTGVEEVKEVARAGERMPQKSTDFFPKIASGLVIADITGAI